MSSASSYYTQIEEELQDGEEERLRVDDFIRDASALRITPFQLDTYANEYIEMRRAQTAHLMEMEGLKNENRILKARMYVHFLHLGSLLTMIWL